MRSIPDVPVGESYQLSHPHCPVPLCFVNRADPGIRAAQKHIALARQEGLTICVELESAEICACYWPEAKKRQPKPVPDQQPEFRNLHKVLIHLVTDGRPQA